MAVSRTGSVINGNISANSGSITGITCPADAIAIVVTFSGVESSTADYFSAAAIAFDGQSLSLGVAGGAENHEQVALFYKFTPNTGASKTLTYDFAETGTPTEGVIYNIAFYKDCATDALRTTASKDVGDGVWSTGSMATSSGDLVICVCNGWTATSWAWTNATEVNDVTFTDCGASYAEASPSGSVTISATHTGGDTTGCLGAIALKVSSGAAATTKKLAALGVG